MPVPNLNDIDERDLSDAPRLAKESNYKGIIALVVAAVLLVALLVYSSFPELSPEEIISMDGYEGEQPTKTIFNIHSFDDDAEKLSVSASESVTAPAVSNPAASNPVVQNNAELPIAATEPVPEESVAPAAVEEAEAVVAASVESAAPEPVVQTELPVAVTEPVEAEPPIAVTEPVTVVQPVTVASKSSAVEDASSRVVAFSSADSDKVVAAMATTPTIEESADTVVVASVTAIEPIPVPVDASVQQSTNAGPGGNFLPLRSVVQDAIELKASPSAQSRTLLMLSRGMSVTVFESDGEWIHIGTNDGSSITGYVGKSSLGSSDQ